MGRKQSDTVEYFPHFVNQGKTLFILKSKYGNDGYAAWFQLLEVLCRSEDHYYDCNKEDSWQYLVAQLSIKEITATEILNLLAKLGNIDAGMWEKKVIWCGNLVTNLSVVYRKRGRAVPEKPILNITLQKILDIKHETVTEKPISVAEKPHSKVEYSRVEYSKAPLPPKSTTAAADINLPNIFTLYEQEIGKLTPQVIEQLKDIETLYPADWIVDAFKESAGRARSWKYIEGILKRWSTEGRTVPSVPPTSAPRPAIPAGVLAAAQEQPSPDIGPGEAWEQVKALIKPRVNAMNYAYFEGTIGLEWRGVCLVVQASPYSAEYFSTKVRSMIENALIEVTGNKCLVVCQAGEEVACGEVK